ATSIYTLSLHDALPIWPASSSYFRSRKYSWLRERPSRLAAFDLFPRHSRITCAIVSRSTTPRFDAAAGRARSRGCSDRCAALIRSEEHTSELQSLAYLV